MQVAIIWTQLRGPANCWTVRYSCTHPKKIEFYFILFNHVLDDERTDGLWIMSSCTRERHSKRLLFLVYERVHGVWMYGRGVVTM